MDTRHFSSDGVDIAYIDEGANYNRLVSQDLVDPVSGSAPLRSYACDVAPLEARAARAES